MAKKVKVKMQSKGAAQILKDSAIQNDLRDRVNRMAAQAGPGFVAEVTVGRTRAVASVTATTFEARQAEAENRTLTKSLDAAR